MIAVGERVSEHYTRVDWPHYYLLIQKFVAHQNTFLVSSERFIPKMKRTSKPNRPELINSDLTARILALCNGEDDEIAIMATVACELYHDVNGFDWVGFYRVVEPGLLKIGPYQGRHGCLVIPFARGVCGAAARDQKIKIVDDVKKFDGHIACSDSTQSELVIPCFGRDGKLLAVLDIDSDQSAFSQNKMLMILTN